jgi:hypothetical protein
MKARRPGPGHLVLAIAFVLVATANSAGYRYGASDQAFYIPAVLRHLDASLFPRDAPLIDSQARLTIVDEAIAGAARITHLSLPHLFLAGYVLTLLLLLGGALRLAAHYYRSRWTLFALAAALSLRHAIAKTGANSLEGYFHPRQLAFALGVWAAALAVERRRGLALVLLLAAAAVHSTTAAWFAVLVGTAIVVDRDLRWRPIAAGAVALAAAAILLVTVGPLAGRFGRMDPEWLAVIAGKDYLFPLRWPLGAWLTNVVTVPVILLGWQARRRAGRTFAGEGALVAGAMALALVFLAWLPFNAARVALAVQLQVSRIFWPLDFLAVLYLVWLLAESGNGLLPSNRRPSRAAVVAIVIAAFAVARGVYSLGVQFPDRPLFAVDFDNRDWRDAMRWARSTDSGSGWLADPLHAARYGSSLRAAGQRDVFLEEMKDTAIAMYDRSIALRVAERERALAAHAWNTADGARALASAYGLDYLVVDEPLPLPEAYRAGTLYIYRLR